MDREQRKGRRTGGRALRVARVVLRVFALASTAIFALALFSLELPPVRRFVVGRVNEALRSTFAGRITIEKVDHIGLTAIRGARVRIDDPDGTRVLLVDGADVRISPVSTLRSVLFDKGDMVIDLADVKLAFVDADLDAASGGGLRLASAFRPKDEHPSAPAARKTAIRLRHVGMTHAWLHGRPPGAPPVNADVDRLAASALVGSAQKVELDGVEITTRGMPRNADLHLTIDADFAAPADGGKERAAHANVRGEVGGISMTAHASLDGKSIEAMLDVPKATPDMIAAIAPGVTPTQDLSVHADARGTLPDIEASVRATAGRGTLELYAGIAGDEDKVVRVTLAARTIDARAISATAPPSALDVDARLDVAMHADGEIAGTYAVDLLGGTVGAAAAPNAHLGGSLRATSRAGEPSSMSLRGSAAVEDPGVRARVDFEARKTGDAPATATFDAAGTAELAKTRFGAEVSGLAELEARGTATFGKVTTLDADADLRASNVAQADRKIERAWLRAHVRGASDDPRIDAIFQGSGLAASGMRFATAALTAHGSLHRADVTLGLEPRDAPRIGARATLEMGTVITVRDASIALSRDDQRAVIGVRSLRVGGGELRVDGMSVEGLGDPLRAAARRTESGWNVKASTSEIDLSRVAKLLRSTDIRDGHASFDVDVDVRRSAARGHVRAALVQGQFARARNANGNLDVTLQGRSIDAVLHANVGDVGKIDVGECHVEVDGDGPLGDSALKTAHGAVSFAADVDLARVRSVLPRGSVPLTDLAGKLRLEGKVTRAGGADAVPDIRLSAATQGLLLSGRGESEQVDGARVLGYRPWTLEGVDVELTASLAHDTGATDLGAHLSDAKGLLASFDVRSPELPYRDWLRGRPLTIERIGALPVAARLEVPRRDLKTLPAVLKTRQFSGDIALDASLDGTLEDPDVRFSLELTKFASTIGAGTKPLDAKSTGRYARGEGKVDIDISSGDRRLLAGELAISARVRDLMQPPGSEGPAWRASSRVRLSDFPLETSGLFSDLRMKGFASGEISADDVHENGRANVDLAFRDLGLGRAKFPRGTARAELDGTSLTARVRLDQTDGFVEANAKTGMAWGRDTAPRPTTDVPSFATLRANGFRASAILPFVSSAVSELDGRVDADARIDVKQGGGPPNMKGTVTLRDGMIQLTRVGEPLHGVNARVIVTPDGLVRLDDLTAHGSSGTLSAKAVARMNGFDLVAARMNLRIPHRDPLPVDVDGEDIGDVDGDVAVSVDRSPDGRTTKVAVDIPKLHTDLPLSSSHKVQELGEAKGVRMGYFRRQRQFVLLPMNAEDLEEADGKKDTPASPARTEIAVHLGKDVEIKRGTTLKVQLEGDPKIQITDQARMSGQIRLTRGILEVQGKRFEIERGTVTFVGDEPGNPQIIVTAGWTAPDGTRVYADFVGPLKTGKVKLRSEPARPQNEILALIMFGTAEGSSATPYAQQQPSGATRAGATAGGFATEGLSKGLDELTGLEVSTKIDTSNSANPKPEIEVQIARDISLQLGYVLGTPPPGTNPDRTLVTLDWRFKRNWSMEATFGDQGSSIMDFVWQYRY
jgi:translocation and assembly module TamB